MSFVHLHCHSEYSLLDGANRIGDLIRRAQELEQPALALTDHGCMFGAWVFQEQARRAGIRPIVGMEAYVAPGSRHERSRAKGEKGYYHLVLLARDFEGYRNLGKLTSIGYTEGFYGKPRIDREVLAKHAGGLIVTSACLAGEVAQHLMEDRWDAAREAVAWHQELFGDRYYLEVQAHDSPGQDELNRRIFRLAEESGAPVVATNDAHFLRAADHQAHDVLLCIGLGKDFSDPNRMKYDGQLYFKSGDEMRERFPGRPDVLENTLAIAEACSWSYPKGYHVPAFPVKEQGFESEADMLRDWVWRGVVERYAPDAPAGAEPTAVLPPALVERTEYELSVICNPKVDYSGYFLITADFIKWARDHGIPVGPGRGSAAGSIVAYATGITDICPIEFDLLFERFLNPERVSMPDIDVDFCFERRGEVIEYVREKYGRDAVGQIITFGTMKSRAVVKDVGRTLGFLPAETDRLAKLIPNGPAYSLTVQEAREKIPEVKELYEKEERYRQLLDYSSTLEGLSRHSSVHAAGVVIAPGPLDDYVPICTQSTKGSGGNGESVIVTQYDMNCLEKAGMLKMDFLGLKTLTVIHDAVTIIRARHGALRHPETGVEYTHMERVPLDDPAVYRMLARGGTSGVFQFESQLATEKLRQMKADRFDDLIATNALIRPGPLDMGMDQVYIRRKLGHEPVRYPHPELAEVLEPTYGVIVYQEQVMRIAQILGGLSLAEADVLRKAVGKKDADLIAKELGKFVEKAVEKGHERRVIQDLADQIEAFGRYGFNKCLPGDVEVLDSSSGRLVRIEDLYHRRASIGGVVTCDPDTLLLGTGTVADVVDNGVKPVYRLTTESGREIEATENHPFLTYDGWKPLGELESGVHVAVPRTLPVEGSAVWPDHEVIALGHLLAEGNLCHPHSLYFYSKDPEEVADFVASAEAFDNVRCTVADNRGTASVHAARVDRSRPAGIVAWAEGLEMRGKGAREKEVPAEAFTLGVAQIALLLSRMWAGDGHINVKDRSLFYATASRRLAGQVQHLLLRLGVLARIRTAEFPYRGGRTGYQVFVTGNENLRRFAETVGERFHAPARRAAVASLVLAAPAGGPSKDLVPVRVRDLVRTAKERSGQTWGQVEAAAGVCARDFYPVGTNPRKIGSTRETVALLGEHFGDEALRRFARSDVLWDRVASIEYVGEKRTYDLEVPVTHNFVANDIVVHNSHSAAYGLLSYQTAWLKCHYPAEFMAALMSSVVDRIDDVVAYIAQCREMGKYLPRVGREGIEVLAPHVNESNWKFTVVGDRVGSIRFGLGAIRGVGEGAVRSILAARDAGGPFTSLFDFLSREQVDIRLCNKRVMEALICAGAFDGFDAGGGRAQLLAGLDAAFAAAQTVHDDRNSAQDNFFGALLGGDEGTATMVEAPPLPQVEKWTETERLAREKEILGFFISGHPLNRFREDVALFETRTSTATLKAQKDTKVELACVVTEAARQVSKRDGSEWGRITVEDFHGTATVLAFGDSWARHRELLRQDAPVVIRGAVSGRERDEEDPPLFLDGVVPLEQVRAGGEVGVAIELGSDGPAPERLEAVKAALAEHAGEGPLLVEWTGGGAERTRLRSSSLRVTPRDELLRALREALGDDRVRLHRDPPPVVSTAREERRARRGGGGGGE